MELNIPIQELKSREDLELLVEGDLVKLNCTVPEEVTISNCTTLTLKRVEEPRAYAGDELILGVHGPVRGLKFIKEVKSKEDETQLVISEYCIAEDGISFFGGKLLIGLIKPRLGFTHKVYVPKNVSPKYGELTKLYHLPIMLSGKYDHYKEIIEKSGLESLEVMEVAK